MAVKKGEQNSADGAVPIQRYRARVRAPDGTEVISEVLEFPPPLLAADWQGVLAPGARAAMGAKAPGRDGQTITFFVEQRAGGAWTLLGKTDGHVHDNAVRAHFTLPGEAPAPAAGAGAPATQDQHDLVYHPPPQTTGAPASPASKGAGDGTAAPAGGYPEVRFRVRADDGREMASPPRSLDPACNSPLSDPQWINADSSPATRYQHSSAALMQVTAKGLDGARVRFTVEQQQGDDWHPYGSIVTVVQNEVALGRIQAHHPILHADHRGPPPRAAEMRAARPAQLRFHAELI